MANRQPEIIVAVTVTFGAATIILALRVVARKLRKVTLWLDDWLAVLAWFAAFFYDTGAFVWLQIGLGCHIQDVHMPATRASYYRELFQFILEQAYSVSIASSQLSLLALYWRAFGPIFETRVAVGVMAACSSAWFLCRVFLVTFQCNPPAAKWDVSVSSYTCAIDTGRFFLATVTTHLILDILLMALPAWQIRKLHLPFLEKSSIMALFMFGCVVCFCSGKMMQQGLTYNPSSPDVFWLETGPVIWSATEINLSVITASLPLMRPIFQRLGCCLGRPDKETRRCSPQGPRDGREEAAEAGRGREMPGHGIYGQGTGPRVAISSNAAPRRQEDGGRPPSGSFHGCIRVTKDLDYCVSRASRSIE